MTASEHALQRMLGAHLKCRLAAVVMAKADNAFADAMAAYTTAIAAEHNQKQEAAA